MATRTRSAILAALAAAASAAAVGLGALPSSASPTTAGTTGASAASTTIPTSKEGCNLSGVAGPVAVAVRGTVAFLATPDSVLRCRIESPWKIEIVAHPAPAVVTLVSTEGLVIVDTAHGTVREVPLALGFLGPIIDGQRLAYSQVSTQVDALAGRVRVPSTSVPPPQKLGIVVDLVTGEQADPSLGGSDPTITRRQGMALLLGARVLRLDQPIPVKLPTLPEHDREDLHLSADGRLMAIERGDEALAGPTGGTLTTITGVRRVVGFVHQRLLAEDPQGTVTLLDIASARREPTTLPRGLRVVDRSGLLAKGEDERVTYWRLSAQNQASELTALAGYEVIGAGSGGWWFSNGERPLRPGQTALFSVDPSTGAVQPVVGSLQELAAIDRREANSSPDGRHRWGAFPERRGFNGLAFGDARTGRVNNLDVVDEPIAVDASGRFVVARWVAGVCIGTLGQSDGEPWITIRGIEGTNLDRPAGDGPVQLMWFDLAAPAAS